MEWAKNVPCKNITIYGFCKYENKGCAFSHNKPKDKTVQAKSPESKSSSRSSTPSKEKDTNKDSIKYNPTSAAFKPKFKRSTFDDVPAFVPKQESPNPISVPDISQTSSQIVSQIQSGAQNMPSASTLSSISGKTYSFESSFQPSGQFSSAVSGQNQPIETINPYVEPQTDPWYADASAVAAVAENPYENPYIEPSYQVPNASLPYQSEMYFAGPSTYPLQYHLYAPNTLNMRHTHLEPHEQNIHSLFIPNSIRDSFLKRNEATLQTIQHSALPEYVSVYHTLVPLDKTLRKNTKNYGVSSSLYKVFSNKDGNPYVLRRLEGFQLSNEKALSSIRRWISVSASNSNIVNYYEAFTSLSFGDNSLFFVHDYHPLSKTLKEAHQAKIDSVSESLLWTYIVQLVNAISSIHKSGLAARTISSDKVIITGEKRIKLSGVAILDIVNYDHDHSVPIKAMIKQLQKDDFKQMGELIIELMCYNNGDSVTNVLQANGTDDKIESSLAKMNYYSSEMLSFVKYLLLSAEPDLSEVQTLLQDHTLKVMNSFLKTTDFYENTLSNEIENDRLVRLMTKINSVIDRPKNEADVSWTESGDSYPIKLFMDYVFHSIDQEGRPVVDMTRVLSCLNKLDAGIDEKILLVSADEGSCMVASYKELKQCVDKAFRDLMR